VIEPEQYYAYAGKDATEFREAMRADAFKKAKTRLLVKAIAEAEGIETSEEEIEKEIAAIAGMYKTAPAVLRTSMGETGVKMVKEDVRNRKTVDFLFANAVIESAPAETKQGKAGETV
jgi:trigger factor